MEIVDLSVDDSQFRVQTIKKIRQKFYDLKRYIPFLKYMSEADPKNSSRYKTLNDWLKVANPNHLDYWHVVSCEKLIKRRYEKLQNTTNFPAHIIEIFEGNDTILISDEEDNLLASSSPTTNQNSNNDRNLINEQICSMQLITTILREEDNITSTETEKLSAHQTNHDLPTSSDSSRSRLCSKDKIDANEFDIRSYKDFETEVEVNEPSNQVDPKKHTDSDVNRTIKKTNKDLQKKCNENALHIEDESYNDVIKEKTDSIKLLANDEPPSHSSILRSEKSQENKLFQRRETLKNKIAELDLDTSVKDSANSLLSKYPKLIIAKVMKDGGKTKIIYDYSKVTQASTSKSMSSNYQSESDNPQLHSDESNIKNKLNTFKNITRPISPENNNDHNIVGDAYRKAIMEEQDQINPQECTEDSFQFEHEYSLLQQQKNSSAPNTDLNRPSTCHKTYQRSNPQQNINKRVHFSTEDRYSNECIRKSFEIQPKPHHSKSILINPSESKQKNMEYEEISKSSETQEAETSRNNSCEQIKRGDDSIKLKKVKIVSKAQQSRKTIGSKDAKTISVKKNTNSDENTKRCKETNQRNKPKINPVKHDNVISKSKDDNNHGNHKIHDPLQQKQYPENINKKRNPHTSDKDKDKDISCIKDSLCMTVEDSTEISFKTDHGTTKRKNNDDRSIELIFKGKKYVPVIKCNYIIQTNSHEKDQDSLSKQTALTASDVSKTNNSKTNKGCSEILPEIKASKDKNQKNCKKSSGKSLNQETENTQKPNNSKNIRCYGVKRKMSTECSKEIKKPKISPQQQKQDLTLKKETSPPEKRFIREFNNLTCTLNESLFPKNITRRRCSTSYFDSTENNDEPSKIEKAAPIKRRRQTYCATPSLKLTLQRSSHGDDEYHIKRTSAEDIDEYEYDSDTNTIKTNHSTPTASLKNFKNTDSKMIFKSTKTCVLCEKNSNDLTHHYVAKHKTESYVSRLSSFDLHRLETETNRVSPFHRKRYRINCIFCKREIEDYFQNFHAHFTYHTGEYNFQCDGCKIKKPYKEDILSHQLRSRSCRNCKINNVHRLETNVIHLHSCKICNFVCLHELNLKIHLQKQHGSTSNVPENFKKLILLANEKHELIDLDKDVEKPALLAEEKFICELPVDIQNILVNENNLETPEILMERLHSSNGLVDELSLNEDGYAYDKQRMTPEKCTENSTNHHINESENISGLQSSIEVSDKSSIITNGTKENNLTTNLNEEEQDGETLASIEAYIKSTSVDTFQGSENSTKQEHYQNHSLAVKNSKSPKINKVKPCTPTLSIVESSENEINQIEDDPDRLLIINTAIPACHDVVSQAKGEIDTKTQKKPPVLNRIKKSDVKSPDCLESSVPKSLTKTRLPKVRPNTFKKSTSLDIHNVSCIQCPSETNCKEISDEPSFDMTRKTKTCKTALHDIEVVDIGKANDEKLEVETLKTNELNADQEAISTIQIQPIQLTTLESTDDTETQIKSIESTDGTETKTTIQIERTQLETVIGHEEPASLPIQLETMTIHEESANSSISPTKSCPLASTDYNTKFKKVLLEDEERIKLLFEILVENTGVPKSDLYRCCFCNSFFMHFELWVKHIKDKHSSNEDLSCPYCNEQFLLDAAELHFENHLRHEFICYYCFASYSTQEKIEEHFTSSHENSNVTQFKIGSFKLVLNKCSIISDYQELISYFAESLYLHLASRILQNTSNEWEVEKTDQCFYEIDIPQYKPESQTLHKCYVELNDFLATDKNSLEHHLPKTFECKHCKFLVSKSSWEFVKCHHLQHLSPSLYVCCECKFTHYNNDGIMQHIDSLHNNKDVPVMFLVRTASSFKISISVFLPPNKMSLSTTKVCYCCKVKIHDPNKYIDHLKKKHKISFCPRCQLCGKIILTNLDGKLHCKTHKTDSFKLKYDVLTPYLSKLVLKSGSPLTMEIRTEMEQQIELNFNEFPPQTLNISKTCLSPNQIVRNKLRNDDSLDEQNSRDATACLEPQMSFVKNDTNLPGNVTSVKTISLSKKPGTMLLTNEMNRSSQIGRSTESSSNASENSLIPSNEMCCVLPSHSENAVTTDVCTFSNTSSTNLQSNQSQYIFLKEIELSNGTALLSIPLNEEQQPRTQEESIQRIPVITQSFHLVTTEQLHIPVAEENNPNLDELVPICGTCHLECLDFRHLQAHYEAAHAIYNQIFCFYVNRKIGCMFCSFQGSESTFEKHHAARHSGTIKRCYSMADPMRCGKCNDFFEYSMPYPDNSYSILPHCSCPRYQRVLADCLNFSILKTLQNIGYQYYRYSCDICRLSTYIPQQFIDHNLSVHNQLIDPLVWKTRLKYFCSICSALGSYNIYDVIYHLRISHLIPMRLSKLQRFEVYKQIKVAHPHGFVVRLKDLRNTGQFVEEIFKREIQNFEATWK